MAEVERIARVPIIRRPRVYRRRVDPFADYDDVDFFHRYRFTKPIARFICNSYVLAGYGKYDGRATSVSDELMVMTALRYLSTGSMYREVADSHGVSRATVVRAVSRLAEFLVEISNEWIRMPATAEERFDVAQKFQEKYGMPRCVGAVDGTHITMIRPSENEAVYVNRHFTHSLNVQAACDADMVFMSVNATMPGSCHDNFVFNNSDLGINASDGQLGDFFLLGDSGYALRPWIMTPFLNPQGQGQLNYNNTHKTARSIIERAFGRLKMRFRSLSKGGGDLQTTPEKVSNLIVACFVLHNMAELQRMPLPADDEDFEDLVIDNDAGNDEGDEQRQQVAGYAAGARVRDALARDVFNNNH